MGRLMCRCLNVAVHYKGETWSSTAVEGVHVLPTDCGHRLCNATLYEVDLDVAGISSVSEGERMSERRSGSRCVGE